MTNKSTVSMTEAFEALLELHGDTSTFLMAAINDKGECAVVMPFLEAGVELDDLKMMITALTMPIIQMEKGELTKETLKEFVDELADSDDFIDRVLH